ncbi:MAG TPA: hypothetical protein VLX28_02515 [Thermoanaerobaculia bacterium]|nr:hypothetical protein [Thermoanaerobaculia bacterium]
MSFCDFKGIWWVQETPNMTGEMPNHKVVIYGIDQVKIICIDDPSPSHAFLEAQYFETPTEGIEVKDKQGNLHNITLTKGSTNQITCAPGPLGAAGGPGPGSWTANDNGGTYGPNVE